MGGSALSKLQCDYEPCSRRFGHVGPGQYESGHSVYVGMFCTRVDLCNDCYETLNIGAVEAIARGIEGTNIMRAERERAAREERAYQRRRQEAEVRGDHLSTFPAPGF